MHERTSGHCQNNKMKLVVSEMVTGMQITNRGSLRSYSYLSMQYTWKYYTEHFFIILMVCLH